jgi:hypothetical protein
MGGIRHRTHAEKPASGLPIGSPSRSEGCLNANRRSDSLHVAGDSRRANSNHIPVVKLDLKMQRFESSRPSHAVRSPTPNI